MILSLQAIDVCQRSYQLATAYRSCKANRMISVHCECIPTKFITILASPRLHIISDNPQ